MKKVVAVDFDGVIYNSNLGSGLVPILDVEPIDGVRTFFEALREQGYEIVVLSSRALSAAGKKGIADWLIANDLFKFTIDVTNIKVGAVAYVDNRAVRYDDGNWEDCLDLIINLASRRG